MLLHLFMDLWDITVVATLVIKELCRTFFTRSLKDNYSSNYFSGCNTRLIANQQFLKTHSVTGREKCLMSYETEFFSFLLSVLHNMCGYFPIPLTDRWHLSTPQNEWVFFSACFFTWWVYFIQHTSCASHLWPRWLWPRKWWRWRQVLIIVYTYIHEFYA